METKLPFLLNLAVAMKDVLAQPFSDAGSPASLQELHRNTGMATSAFISNYLSPPTFFLLGKRKDSIALLFYLARYRDN